MRTLTRGYKKEKETFKDSEVLYHIYYDKVHVGDRGDKLNYSN